MSLEFNKVDLNKKIGGNDNFPSYLRIFWIDPRYLFLYLKSKWKWILLVFGIACLLSLIFITVTNTISSERWLAHAKVLHQSRSNKVPKYYENMDTGTILQFFTSQKTRNLVSEKLKLLSKSNFTPTLVGNVEVAQERRNSPTILITAYANNPDLAVTIANEVANQGIKAYTDYQNQSMFKVIQDYQKQMTNIDRDISQIQIRKKNLYSENSLLSPDIELSSKNLDLSSYAFKKEELLIELKTIDITINSIKEHMSQTPQMIDSEQHIDNRSSLGLTGKKAELESLLKRYTEENPKVQVIKDEIEILERNLNSSNQIPDISVLRLNPVYSKLQSDLATYDIQKKTLIAQIEQYENDLTKREDEIKDLINRREQYNNLTIEEDRLRQRNGNILDKISDLEYLIGTSLPDVTIFELASKAYSKTNHTKFLVIIVGISASLLFLFVLVAYQIFRLRIFSSSEYKTALHIANLGELAAREDHSKNIVITSFQNMLEKLKQFSKNKKSIFLKFDPTPDLEDILQQTQNALLINGIKIFRLHCLPASQATDIINLTPLENDELSQKMIAVKKIGDQGYYIFLNNLSMNNPEIDLLKFDIELLLSEYDHVILETIANEKNILLSIQLAQITEEIIITSTFEKTNKFLLNKHIEHMKGVSDLNIGGILSNVPKPYFNI